jgi:hypothetical protein
VCGYGKAPACTVRVFAHYCTVYMYNLYICICIYVYVCVCLIYVCRYVTFTYIYVYIYNTIPWCNQIVGSKPICNDNPMMFTLVFSAVGRPISDHQTFCFSGNGNGARPLLEHCLCRVQTLRVCGHRCSLDKGPGPKCVM